MMCLCVFYLFFLGGLVGIGIYVDVVIIVVGGENLMMMSGVFGWMCFDLEFVLGLLMDFVVISFFDNGYYG